MAQTERERRERSEQKLERENARLRHENERLKREIERLREELEKATRAGKGQAAPFSRGEPKRKPRRPGRKTGKRYGRRGQRAAPAQVDEVKAAPLPARCACGGCVQLERTEAQYQEDIECRTVRRRFNIAIGRCQRCRKRMQGRHPRQTSDALGAAHVQIGPQTLSLAAVMTKQMALSLGRAEQLLAQGFGLSVHRSTLSLAMERLARKAEPSYATLLERARPSIVNAMDETGWRVGGQSHWAHVAVGEEATVYTIQRGRGFAEAASLIGEDYAGFLVRDGWAPFRKFQQAFHQSCLHHLITRCKELEAADPRQVKQLLHQALRLRDRHQRGRVSEKGMAVAAGLLEQKLDRLLARLPRAAENRKLAQHLRNERPHLFTFLRCPGLAATNHQAEQALRGLVIPRKVWGGNRTARGARTQAVLLSLMRASRQQWREVLPLLMELLRQRHREALDLAVDSS
ncbi:MAG: IS66 family transposase [Bryobacterales bacterium]|nr:IS66 family transposase [Bryobacterales bacterium]